LTQQWSLHNHHHDSTTQWLATTSSTTTTFEPVLNVPALGSFVLIMTMALLLQWRISAIGQAAETRMAALEHLRRAKVNQLANNNNSNNNNNNNNTATSTNEQVQDALRAYEEALAKEEELRTILPGIIRLRAPNNPLTSVRDLQVARQFLGANATILQQLQQDQDDENDDKPSNNLPPLALGALWAFLLLGSQILLFLFLSMNDTVATEVFNSLSDGSETVATELGITPLSTTAETIADVIMGME
jgi:hypothetical protein